MNYQKLIRASVLAFSFLLVQQSAVFGNDNGCCSCPECGAKVCVAKPVIKKTKKTVFTVDKKDICIPKFRFPWQMKKNNSCGNGGGAGCDSSCDSGCASGNCGQGNCGGCAPQCGRVKTVKVLKKKSIECEKCGYEWEITTVAVEPCGAGCGIGSRFGLRAGSNAGCDDAACDSSYFKPAKTGDQPMPQPAK